MTNHESDMTEKINKIKLIAPEMVEHLEEILPIIETVKDPLLVAAIVFKLAKQKEEHLEEIKRIEEKLIELEEKLTARIESIEKQIGTKKIKMNIELSDQDKKIVELIKKKGAVSAKDVKEALKYKGLNAASQRLNKLYRMGVLEKIQSGKKMLYLLKAI